MQIATGLILHLHILANLNSTTPVTSYRRESGISMDIYMVLKAFNLSLDELNMIIEGYEDTAQLIPINAYHRLIFCGRILIGVVIDSNEYSHIPFRNRTCACKISSNG